LLRTVVDAHDATAVAEKIRTALSQPFEVNHLHLAISCSIGIALYPQHGADSFELSKNADMAMYQAKQSGGHSVQMFGSMP
jgi:diguanylate cyclase (GGDEF)-like protein